MTKSIIMCIRGGQSIKHKQEKHYIEELAKLHVIQTDQT